MNILTRHLHEQDISYIQHASFALGIALRLSASVVMFTLHGLLPWISIQRRYDLEATSVFLVQQNDWIESTTRRLTDEVKNDFDGVTNTL
ncbi:MAG: DUF6356 family protein [Candidatus Thiodiazotropha sp.]|nr:hypothetical protein [Candidatus Thiodiazotropha taylori]MBT3060435.1 hypothetical protein [Candidatus Thiodiazotropha sp. (ex Lucina pensylvanica)]MBT3063755.1 hypothetical protein [Candidatus Thiodiazotropha sp. (ex Lucina pensylvanica)]MBV2095071.1 hypothetical protein [Candidatus Thiodiazotropha sp. (ex Codakia orbicularis)]